MLKSPPLPEEEMEKPVPTHIHTHIRYQETVKDFQIHPERKSTKRPGLWI